MAQLKIIKGEELESESIRGSGEGAGHVTRVIATEKFFFNIDEVNPGHSPHHWHRHVNFQNDTHKVEYPADFEEIYYIFSGHGVIQWKTDSGEIREQEVGPGDTVYTPADVVEHQLLNNGSETIRMAVVGVPPSRRTPLG